MAMKETENSLRWYFLLAGAFATLSSLKAIGDASKLPAMRASWTLAIWFPIVAHLVLGVAFVAAGIQLKRALASDPTWIKRMLIGSGTVLVVELVLICLTWGTATSASAEGRFAGAVGGGIFGLAITAYLYANVNRLSRESRSSATGTVFE